MTIDLLLGVLITMLAGLGTCLIIVFNMIRDHELTCTDRWAVLQQQHGRLMQGVDDLRAARGIPPIEING